MFRDICPFACIELCLDALNLLLCPRCLQCRNPVLIGYRWYSHMHPEQVNTLMYTWRHVQIVSASAVLLLFIRVARWCFSVKISEPPRTLVKLLVSKSPRRCLIAHPRSALLTPPAPRCHSRSAIDWASSSSVSVPWQSVAAATRLSTADYYLKNGIIAA